MPIQPDVFHCAHTGARVPEKRRPHCQGYNTGDVIGLILGAKTVKLTSSEETSSLVQFGI